jgi:hypothetical protein
LDHDDKYVHLEFEYGLPGFFVERSCLLRLRVFREHYPNDTMIFKSDYAAVIVDMKFLSNNRFDPEAGDLLHNWVMIYECQKSIKRQCCRFTVAVC